MKAEGHPEYEEEQKHLERCIEHIEALLARPFHAGGIDGRTDYALALMNRDHIEKLREARHQAYFGRVDHNLDGLEETIYIGRTYIRDLNIYSWADTLAGKLYYTKSPDLLLKRAFKIDYKALQTISDEYVHPSLERRLVAGHFTDSLLNELLLANRTGELHDIIATIQEQQYKIIQSPPDQLLVIEGSPGSGKSSVALHRVAYLLYHHRKQLRNILILGPNRLFMNYVAEILPSLGERNIPQLSCDDWLVQRLGSQVRYKTQDESLELLMSETASHADKYRHYRNAKIKGSLKMAELLERYIEEIVTLVLKGNEPLICRITRRYTQTGMAGQTLEVQAERSAKDVRAMFAEMRELPLNNRKNEVVDRLVAAVTAELREKLHEAVSARTARVNPFERERLEKGIEEEVLPQVRIYLKKWRRINALAAYIRLLQSSELLRDVGMGIFSNSDLTSLNQEIADAKRPLDFSDLPALIYLRILLDGTGGPDSENVSYDHIVVDEAQDLSPMHFKVIAHYMSDVSLTLLGDLTQSIYGHHGMRRWDDLAAIVQQAIKLEAIKESYRSTREITEYANRMLRRVGSANHRLAKPIARRGTPPEQHQFENYTQLEEGVAEIIKAEGAVGRKSIAAICKTSAACERLAQAFEKRHIDDVQMITDPKCLIQGRSNHYYLIPG